MGFVLWSVRGSTVGADPLSPAPHPCGRPQVLDWTDLCLSYVDQKIYLGGSASAAHPRGVQNTNIPLPILEHSSPNPVLLFFWSFFEAVDLNCQVRPICAQVVPSWVPVGPSWTPSGGSERDLGAKLGTQIDQKPIKKSITCWMTFFMDLWSIFIGFWCQLGLQIRSKIDQNRYENMKHFSFVFWLILHWFLLDFDTLKPWFLTNSPREIL